MLGFLGKTPYDDMIRRELKVRIFVGFFQKIDKFVFRGYGLKVFLLVLMFGSAPSYGETVGYVSTVKPEVKLSASKMALVNHRRRHDLNHIYLFENSPLGNRVPVILIPGRAEEYQRNAWWKTVREMTVKNKAFNEQFKLYVFIYDSTDELDRQALDFVKEMRMHFGHFPTNRQVVLVSYSLGGVITREAMEQKDIRDRIHTVIALGVPFHGSPIFDPDWFTQYMKPQNHSPIRQFWDRLVYRTYLFNKTNLTRGLKWDNFDSSKPQFRAHELKGDQVATKILPYDERDTTRIVKKKMIIYASYMDNKYTLMKRSGLDITEIVDRSASLPKEILGSVLPVYGTSVHAVFTYMNHQLSNLPTFSSEYPDGKNSHLYRFNDGVIPLSSALYLPGNETPYSGDMDTLVKAIDVQMARIFVDIDHMHLGEYSRNPKRIQAVDILHPGEGERTPNHWIFYDLQKLLPDLKKASIGVEAL